MTEDELNAKALAEATRRPTARELAFETEQLPAFADLARLESAVAALGRITNDFGLAEMVADDLRHLRAVLAEAAAE